MNQAHLHLIVNHVSLFAMVFGVCALIVSMKRSSVEFRVAASALFILAGLFGWIAFETGEGAEHVLKALGDFESQIEAHEQAAMWARGSGFLVAFLAIAMEVVARKKQTWFKPLRWVLLAFAIHGCTVFAATALQGGFIRHPEIKDAPAHQ